MSTENRRVFVVAATLMLVIVMIAIGNAVVSRRAPTSTVAYVAPTATPPASAAARAEAAALLASAQSQREAGQLGPALRLAETALGLWPDYAEAARFVATAAPEATATAAHAQAQATAEGQQEAARLRTVAEARRLYSMRTQRPLQQFGDAMSGVRQSAREASERPALLDDNGWRSRTAAGLALMQSAADAMTAVTPVPDGMLPAEQLLEQIAAETRLLAEDYTPGLQGVTTHGVASARGRLERLSELTSRANVEVRRIGEAPAS